MDLLSGLNDAQREAVTAPAGPVMVMAGPGSGKTRVLTHRIAYMVHQLGARPRDLLAVTFTNKAAREMRQRVDALLADGGASSAGSLTLGTFHAVSARILRREAEAVGMRRDFVIYDDDDQMSLMRQVVKELGFDPKQVQPARVLAGISRAKGELIGPQEYPAVSYFEEITRRAYQRYQDLLRVNNAFDFDDLLFALVRLLRDQPEARLRYQTRYAHLLVDEFQDTNTSQYALLRLLATEAPDLFVVGDADQSIYRWRGADYRNVRRFLDDYPQARLILLEQNYRSTQTILDAATAVIDRAPARQKKRLYTERGRGVQVRLHEAYDEMDEARFALETIALLTQRGEADPRDVAIMYRTNAQSRVIEEAFLQAGLPYTLVGAQRFYGRREVKDVLAYLRLIQNPSDQVSLLRVLNTPPRGLGAKAIETLLQAAERAGMSAAALLVELGRSASSSLGEGFTARALSALSAFGRMLDAWLGHAESLPVTALLDEVLAHTRYQNHIDDGTEEGAERWENVLELRNVAADFDDVDLASFLENVALVSDQDTLTDAQNAPTLLTLHAAKGLEFPVVLILGLDEGLLPHQRSFDDPEEMAEERRLFYVGITRAKDRLFLVRAQRRRQSGTAMASEPSRFLQDIPSDLVDGEFGFQRTREQSSYQRQTRWDTWSAPPAQKEPIFHSGMRVRHPAFGEGMVIESRLEHDDEVVTIAFQGAGFKRLSVSLARLEILEDPTDDPAPA
jgi:DNA helicase II / ATP-dependent DNA helicase PcrA